METKVLPASNEELRDVTDAAGEDAFKALPYTQDDLRKWFDYDPATGNLIWKEEGLDYSGKSAKTRAQAGEIACVRKPVKKRLTKFAVVSLTIDERRYEHRAHRVVWVWHHGSLPTEPIEHVDGNRLNNRIENLRAEKFDWQALTDEECDILYMEYFASHQRYERALFSRKWWDYRFMHPMKASFAFADAYNDAYRYMTRIRVDARTAPYVNGIARGAFVMSDPRESTGVNIARMAADKHGIPYDFWCRAAMRYAEKMSWTNMPRPTQLYSPEIVAHIVEQWNEEQAVSLRRATHPHYAPESYAQDANQESYQQYLIEHVNRSSSHRHWRLASVMDSFAEVSLAVFGVELLREAKRTRALLSHN